MSKKEQDSSVKIYDYLKLQNRPYSVNDIFLNLHKEIGKTAVQKILDTLVQKGTVKEKTYGKQKVYVVNQDDFSSFDEAKLKEIEQKCNSLCETLKLHLKEVAEAENTLKALSSSLTTEEVEEQIKQINEKISSLEECLSKIPSTGEVITKQQRETLEKDRDTKLKEWKKRKRMTLNVLDAILEGYPKSKKMLFEDIGIETDEDAEVDMKLLN